MALDDEEAAAVVELRELAAGKRSGYCGVHALS
jgi:hypothetical protein